MPLVGAFTALLLIICEVSSVAVQSPLNVTVSCQNLNTTISWNYSQRQPETIFRVNVTGDLDTGSFEKDTTDLQYDISHFVWGSPERFLSYLYVKVTAIEGGKMSATAGKSFSFNQLKTVDIKCELDFPPIEVHATEKGTSIQFPNPVRYYKLKSKSHPRHLVYTVLSDKSDFAASCKETDAICKNEIFPPNMKCVTLKGGLMFGIHATHQVNFRQTNQICTTNDSPPNLFTLAGKVDKEDKENKPDKADGLEEEVVLAAMLGSIFIVVVIVAVVVICRVKAWTMNTPVPSIKHTLGCDQQKFLPTPKDPEISPVSSFEPYESTLIKSGSEKCSKVHQASGSDSDDVSVATESYREYFKRRKPDLEEEGLMSEADGTDEDSTDDSVKTECVSIGSLEKEPCPYDSPQFVMMDMGDGDLVTGYSGN